MAKQSALSSQLHVFGAGSGIGRWFVSHVFSNLRKQAGWYTCAYDISSESLSQLAQLHQDIAANVVDTTNPPQFVFSAQAIVIVAVQAEVVPRLLSWLAPALVRGPTVISFTSVQAPTLEVLRAQLPANCARFGCHPMFGPGVSSIAGLQLAITDCDCQREEVQWLLSHLRERGFGLTFVSAQEHDLAMGVVQGLTHFSFLLFAAALARVTRESKLRIDQLAGLHTPNFRFLNAFSKRVLSMQSATVGAIQKGPFAEPLRRVVLEEGQKLAQALDQASGGLAAAAPIHEIRQALRGPGLAEGADFASWAVARLQSVEEQLFAARASGQWVVVRHRLTGRLRVLRLWEVATHHLRCSQVMLPSEELSVVPLCAESIQNYARLGFGDPRLSPETLRRSSVVISRVHLEVYSGQEAQALLAAHVLPAKTVLHIRAPEIAWDCLERWWKAVLPTAIWNVGHLTTDKTLGVSRIVVGHAPWQSRQAVCAQLREATGLEVSLPGTAS